jgi:hypothetical protein
MPKSRAAAERLPVPTTLAKIVSSCNAFGIFAEFAKVFYE